MKSMLRSVSVCQPGANLCELGAGRNFSPRPGTPGRGVGGEGPSVVPITPQPLSPEYRGEGSCQRVRRFADAELCELRSRADPCARRCGFTLVEMVVSMTVLVVLMTSISVVLRTSRQAWETHQTDLVAIQTAHAVLRHIVRELRESDAVLSVTAKTVTSGDLRIKDAFGNNLRWQHNSSTKQVLFSDASLGGTSQVLAENVNALKFTCYGSDGVSETTVIEQMQFMKIEVTVPVPSSGSTRTISSWVWLRSFGRSQAE